MRSGGDLRVADSVFSKGSAGAGAAVWLDGAAVGAFARATFSGNEATSTQGA